MAQVLLGNRESLQQNIDTNIVSAYNNSIKNNLIGGGRMAEQELTATELLERDYGSDEMAQKLIASFRADEKQTDEEIYKFLESFY